MNRAISLAVCSQSASKSEYSSFILRLKNRYKIEVKYVPLSSHKQLEECDFSHFDAVVLIHSISRGRLSITDVDDAQYGKFLPRICDQLGKGRVAVLVHGLQDPKTLEKVFASEQPTTMKCSSWVKLCTDLLQKDVTDMMGSLLSKLNECPKPTLNVPEPIQAVGPGDVAAKQVNKIKAQTATFTGVGGKLHIPDINLIICAEGCTRDSILQSLCQTKFQKNFLCTVFEQTNDTWKHIQVNQMSRAGPTSGSSPHLRSLLFIYRDKIPSEFNDDKMRKLIDIKTGIGNTEPTPVQVEGTADGKCVSDILRIALSSWRDSVTHIVSVIPGMEPESSDAYHKADGLSSQLVHGKISRAALEYQMEEGKKEQKRSQIRNLENEIGERESELRNLKGEIRSIEKEKEMCSGKVRCLQEEIGQLKKEKSQLSSIEMEVYKAGAKFDEITRNSRAEEEHAAELIKEAESLENTIRSKRKVKEGLDKDESSLKSAIYKLVNRKGKLLVEEQELKEIKSQKLKEKEEDERKHTERCLANDRELLLKSSHLEEVKRNYARSQTNLDLAEKQTKKLHDECKVLTTTCEGLESYAKKARSAMQNTLEDHDKLKKDFSELSTDKEKCKAEQLSIQRENGELLTKLNTLNSDVKELSKVKKKCEVEQQSMHRKTDELLTKIEQLTLNANLLEGNDCREKLLLQKTKENLQQKTEEVSQLSAKGQTMQRQIEQLRRENEQLQYPHTSLETDLVIGEKGKILGKNNHRQEIHSQISQHSPNKNDGKCYQQEVTFQDKVEELQKNIRASEQSVHFMENSLEARRTGDRNTIDRLSEIKLNCERTKQEQQQFQKKIEEMESVPLQAGKAEGRSHLSKAKRKQKQRQIETKKNKSKDLFQQLEAFSGEVDQVEKKLAKRVENDKVIKDKLVVITNQLNELRKQSIYILSAPDYTFQERRSNLAKTEKDYNTLREQYLRLPYVKNDSIAKYKIEGLNVTCEFLREKVQSELQTCNQLTETQYSTREGHSFQENQGRH